MNDAIQIYIAAFNAEKTIARTIDSILAQTCKNFKLFICDNGSTDNTFEIIESYAQKYDFISIARRKTNFSGSFIRAIYSFYDVVDLSIGDGSYSDWTAFIDADDTIEPTYLEDMLSFARQNGLDMVTCGWKFIRPDRIDLRTAERDEVIPRGDFAARLRDYDKFMGPVWNKLFKTETLGHNVAYYENKYAKIFRNGVYFYGADTAFNYFYLGNGLEKFGILAKPLYNYYISDESVSRKRFHPMRIIGDRRMAEFRFDFLEEIGGVSKENYDFIMNIYFKSVQATMELLRQDDRYDLKEKMRYYREMFEYGLMRDAFQKFRGDDKYELSSRNSGYLR